MWHLDCSNFQSQLFQTLKPNFQDAYLLLMLIVNKLRSTTIVFYNYVFNNILVPYFKYILSCVMTKKLVFWHFQLKEV